MTQSPTPRSDRGPRPASGFVDEAELDIAEFLRDEEDEPISLPKAQSYRVLVIGAIGVVYGDIGTSPIYAFREALRPVLATGGPARPEVLGLLSLLI